MYRTLYVSSVQPCLSHRHGRTDHTVCARPASLCRAICRPAQQPSSESQHYGSAHGRMFAAGPGLHPGSKRRVSLAAAPAAVAAVASTVAQPWNTLAVLCGCAAAAQAAEQHTPWGRLLSAPLLTLLLGVGAAGLGLLPAHSPVYDVVWTHLMPLAVALFLLDHDVSSIRTSGGPVLASFLLGAGAMVAGAAVAWLFCKSALTAAAGSMAAAAQLAACLLASYIGGSVNFIAVAAATALPTGLVPGAMAADNLGMLMLLGMLMATPLRWLQHWQQGRTRQQAAKELPSNSSSSSSSGDSKHGQAETLKVSGVAAPAAASTASPAAPAPAAAVPAAAPTGPLGLDGSPLLTQPPSAADIAACLEATTRRKQQAGARLASQNSTNGNGKAASSNATITNGSSAAAGSAVSEAVTGAAEPSAPAQSAAAAVGKCGGCRASGVTAADDHPLLTRAPGMGDAVSTIAAARQGKQQLLTPPKPQSSSSFTSKQQRGGAASSNRTTAMAAAPASSDTLSEGYNSQVGPDGLMVGCGCCSEALDALAAAYPPPAGLSSGVSSGGGASSSSAVPAGALALDGSLLLTEEPDTDRLAAAVAAARSGGSSGSSVAVSPLSSGEFELLVRLDKDSLLQRLREQEQKQQRQQQQQQQRATRQRKAARIVPVASPSASSSSSSSSSSYSSGSYSSIDGSVDDGALGVAAKTTTVSSKTAPSSSSVGVFSASSAAAAVAAATAACAVAHQLATWIGTPALHQLLLGAIAVTMSATAAAVSSFNSTSSTPQQPAPGAAAAQSVRPRHPFAGASQLAQVLIGVFFAALGASCCCPVSTLACCLPVLGFVGIMTVTHWACLVTLGGGLLGLSPAVLLCGSAAAIGGPATAAGLAAARGWDDLVQPSLLCGSLGYALGTGAGLGLAQLLGVLP